MIGLVLLISAGCSVPRAPAADAGDALRGGDHGEFSVPEWPDREYLIYVPTAYVAGTPTPVVYGFHGGGGKKEGLDATSCADGEPGGPTCMIEVAEREGTILVMADGVDKPGLAKRSWNAGGGADGFRCVGGEACETGSDDVAYVDALRAEVERALSVDPQRVFATGISNGAAMSHRLACERADVFAAIAPVAGANQAMAAPGCAPSQPVPVLHTHGTGDLCWGYDGQIDVEVCRDGTKGLFVGVEDSMAFWREANGCTGTSEAPLPDLADDGLTTTRVSGTGCAADTVLLRVDGGGHTWPGGWQYLPATMIGPVTEDFVGNDEIWAFFKAHPRAEP